MAKRKRGMKSAAVREILQSNPNTPVKEVVSQLASRGIKVNANLVYFIKAKGKAKKRRAVRQRAAATLGGNGTSSANAFDLIRRLKVLAGELGGLKKMKDLVDLLAE